MPPFFKGNPMFFVIMGLVVFLQIALVQYGGDIFATVPLSSLQWVTIIIASASILVIGFLLRISYRYSQERKSAVPS
jgi:P-type Ca2+ transporter type 2C